MKPGTSGLEVLVLLPPRVSDRKVARLAREAGLDVLPLSSSAASLSQAAPARTPIASALR